MSISFYILIVLTGDCSIRMSTKERKERVAEQEGES